MWRHRSGFQVSDNWIVWSAGSLEVATGKIRKRVAESGVVTDLGIDGDFVVTQRNSVADKKAMTELVATELKTGAPTGRIAIAASARFVTLHDGIVYVLVPLPQEVGQKSDRCALQAYDFSKPDDPRMSKLVTLKKASQMTIRITSTGFVLQGEADVTTDWIVRVKK